MNATEIAEVDRRRAIASALFFSVGYRLPIRTIRDQIEIIGYTATVDRVRTDCAWLAEQGLVSVSGEVVALTERGADVVTGRVDQPGVRRPSPGEI